MAWATDPLMTADVVFRDRGANKATISFSLKLTGAGGTEPLGRARLLAIAVALQNASNAGVQSTVLRMSADDSTRVPLPMDELERYKDIEDRGRLKILPVTEDKMLPISVPAPLVSIFLPDAETVDPANAAVQALVTYLAGNFRTYAFTKLLELYSGMRERGRARALPVGIPQLEA